MEAKEALAQVEWEKFSRANKLYEDVDRTLGILSYNHPWIGENAVKRLEEKIGKLEEETLKINPGNWLEEAYIEDLLGKAEYARSWCSEYKPNDSPMILGRIREIGVSGKDIERAKRDVLSEFRNVIDRRFEFPDYGQRSPKTDNEKKDAREFVKKLLEKVFREMGRKGPWKDWDDYWNNWISFTESKGSHCDYVTGNVIISYNDLYYYVDWTNQKMFLAKGNVCMIIGEEALYGHQGHWLQTKPTKLPAFLKMPTTCTRAHAEALGMLGAEKLFQEFLEEVGDEAGLVRYNISRHSIKRKKTLLTDLILETEGIEKAVEFNARAYDCARYKSDEYRRRLSLSRLKQDYDTDRWAYVLAEYLVKDYALSSLGPEEIKILQTGRLSVRGMKELVNGLKRN